MSNLSDEKLTELLKNSKTIAVVGLSSKPERASYGVAKYLQNQGYKIYPVNPMENEVLGEKSYPDLKSLPIVPDIVDIFRRSEDTPPIVDEALEVGAKFIWLQLGISNEESKNKATEKGIPFTQNKCILVEHRRLF